MCRAKSLGIALLSAAWGGPAHAACSTVDDAIATDRPTSPNSSVAVPPGSVQFENGVGAIHQGDGTAYDLPEARVRFGTIACTEFLVDLPDYVHGPGVRGATDLSPAVKHQFQDLPDGLILWATVGIGLPTGDKALAGRGAEPYLQLPASYDLGDGLSLNGMYTITLHPGDRDDDPANQTSVYLDQGVTETTDAFIEYVNSSQKGALPQNSIDFGGSWRYAKLRQIDFKLGFGVDRAAPAWYFTLGYSLRFDQLF